MVSSIKPETAGTDVTTLVEERELPPKTAAAADGILAPMPGKVVAVKVNLGDDVKPGDVVVILEAMKMENEITSNRDGKISEVRVKEGDSVDADDVLVVVG
ncbi:MAG: biotin/lipoyl-binding protein [Thermoplasmata archaeon]|nr:MAG: biotin/lipoyl-binding protein [Thermoplasmata archaeon]